MHGRLKGGRRRAGSTCPRGSVMFTNKMSSRFEGAWRQVLLRVVVGSPGS